ncbi:MAG: hypothetical protein K9N23_00220 [Akkermansiaceae bacterium]|nr:hypothetical protein [Akkermansiaceae bacterium]MCF7730074.1 hypothetical protein [Akkermansiaceae bacterium]
MPATSKCNCLAAAGGKKAAWMLPPMLVLLIVADFIGLPARDDLAAALAWHEPFQNQVTAYFEAHPELPEIEKIAVLSKAFDFISIAALDQGAEAAIRACEGLGRLSCGSLPENFDHARLMAALGPERLRATGDAAGFLNSWACHDRDAALAFARTMKPHGPEVGVGLVSAVFSGVCRLEGEAAAAQWLSATVASEAPEQRGELIASLYAGSFLPPSPTTFRQIYDALGDEDERMAFGSGLIDPQRDCDLARTYLDQLPTMDQRVAVIEAAARRWVEDAPSPSHGV